MKIEVTLDPEVIETIVRKIVLEMQQPALFGNANKLDDKTQNLVSEFILGEIENRSSFERAIVSIMEGNADNILDNIDYRNVARELNTSDIAEELDLRSIANEIDKLDLAKEIDLEDLSDELNYETIAENVDLESLATAVISEMPKDAEFIDAVAAAVCKRVSLQPINKSHD
jgi:hypothetical protein